MPRGALCAGLDLVRTALGDVEASSRPVTVFFNCSDRASVTIEVLFRRHACHVVSIVVVAQTPCSPSLPFSALLLVAATLIYLYCRCCCMYNVPPSDRPHAHLFAPLSVPYSSSPIHHVLVTVLSDFPSQSASITITKPYVRSRASATSDVVRVQA
ncbi:hypothetical protein GY45DRAFT_788412 [Cubamyces sp. BRFM 1775]|nr:hypothetical protein GY45DRAFT_788412 [Cubamyces sp. BRFM 1775]